MSSVLIGLLGALMATNQPVAVSNLIVNTTGLSVSVPDPNDPVDKEIRKLMEDDDAAQEEVDHWILENQAFATKGAGVSDAELNRRIRERFAPIRRGYEEFIRQHPDNVKARVAYGSFLGDLHDEDGAQEQLEKALALNSQDPAVYNNLANIYGHIGPVKKSFEYYAKAIELNPHAAVYYQNFATTVFLFRKDAMEFYDIPEQQVFDKALALYGKARDCDPKNFELATDIAQTYYGIKPPRTESALQAWTNAFSLAGDENEREGVQLHFARIKLHAGRFAEARDHLNQVTNEAYGDLKKRLVRNLAEEEARVATNSNPAAAIAPTNSGPAKP